MNKRILYLLAFLLFLLIGANQVRAQENINIYFFWGNGCPHCAEEEPFLEQLKAKYPNIEIRDFEVWYNKDNQKLLQSAGEILNKTISGVPFTVVGEQNFTGYLSDATTGANIEVAVSACNTAVCVDPLAQLFEDTPENNPVTTIEPQEQDSDVDSAIPKSIDVPIFGTIKTENLSLPLLTVVLGALDGFNPCAMWTLIFLIGLLLGMKDKRRMWILGSAFILASAAVYFLFMAAWLNLLQFLGAVVWIRALIGLVALGGGGYYLKEYFSNKDASCKVTGQEKRQRTFERLKRYTQEKSFWLALGGIVVLAMAVNLVELICSAGLPAVYTQVLSLSDLAPWQYYAYLLLYIFIFLLDDLFVFFVAMKTMQVTGITTKYARASHLIGGVAMLIIGLLLIIKPEWLMFG
ncbi:MAG: thioredoxin family protein [Patescibacteria group bacterium]